MRIFMIFHNIFRVFTVLHQFFILRRVYGQNKPWIRIQRVKIHKNTWVWFPEQTTFLCVSVLSFRWKDSQIRW